MAVPTGAASFSDIQTEFGGSNPVSLNEYYSGGSLTKADLGVFAPNGVPTSGTISVNDFRGAENTSEVWSTTITAGSASIASTTFRGFQTGIAGSLSDSTPDNGRVFKAATISGLGYPVTTPKGQPSTFTFTCQIFHASADSMNTDLNSFKFTTDGSSTLQRSDANYAISPSSPNPIHSWTWPSNSPGFTQPPTPGSGTRTQTFDCD